MRHILSSSWLKMSKLVPNKTVYLYFKPIAGHVVVRRLLTYLNPHFPLEQTGSQKRCGYIYRKKGSKIDFCATDYSFFLSAYIYAGASMLIGRSSGVICPPRMPPGHDDHTGGLANERKGFRSNNLKQSGPCPGKPQLKELRLASEICIHKGGYSTW